MSLGSLHFFRHCMFAESHIEGDKSRKVRQASWNLSDALGVTEWHGATAYFGE